MDKEELNDELPMIMIENGDGTEIPFYILDKATILDNEYYLAIDSDNLNDSEEMLILENTADSDSDDLIFDIVDDESVLKNVMAVFEEQLDIELSI